MKVIRLVKVFWPMCCNNNKKMEESGAVCWSFYRLYFGLTLGCCTSLFGSAEKSFGFGTTTGRKWRQYMDACIREGQPGERGFHLTFWLKSLQRQETPLGGAEGMWKVFVIFIRFYQELFKMSVKRHGWITSLSQINAFHMPAFIFFSCSGWGRSLSEMID